MSKTELTNYKAVSLFSNCGAGDLGYREAGFQFEVMAELDPRRLEVCLLNHPDAEGVPGDLRETWTEVVKKYRKRVGETPPAFLSACPPCQGMSSARSGRGKGYDADAGSKDERNLLVEVIALVAKELKPIVTAVENVPAFLTKKVRHPDTNQPISAASLLISRLSEDYEVFPIITDLCDFGVPQSRRRSFLTFVKKGVLGLNKFLESQRIPYPRPDFAPEYEGTARISITAALSKMNLPSLDAKSKETAKSPNPLHFVPVWEERRYAMVAAIPPNSGKTAWENNKCFECGEVEVGDDAVFCPLCASPLLRPIVKDPKVGYRLVKGFKTSSYKRMHPEKPSSTITTASGHVGSDGTIHPYENRVLSALECAYLQTFPDDFNWGDALKKWGHTNVREMIGEAIPPLFTELHGRILMGLLTGQWTAASMSNKDARFVSAKRKLNLL